MESVIFSRLVITERNTSQSIVQNVIRANLLFSFSNRKSVDRYQTLQSLETVKFFEKSLWLKNLPYDWDKPIATIRCIWTKIAFSFAYSIAFIVKNIGIWFVRWSFEFSIFRKGFYIWFEIKIFFKIETALCAIFYRFLKSRYQHQIGQPIKAVILKTNQN